MIINLAIKLFKFCKLKAGVPFQLNRIYLATLMIEDSFHYLLFALIFMNNSPITSDFKFNSTYLQVKLAK